jgi:translation elongation factor EF-G
MRVVVVTPEQFLGDIVGNLRARRGSIKKIAPVGELQGVLAMVPLAELAHYPNDLDHLTGGQARYQIRFSHYQTNSEDSDGGAGVRSPLKPRSPTRSGGAEAKPPGDAGETMN